MVHPPSPAALSERTNESDGDACRTRGPDHDSPMPYGVHRKHGDTSPGASTRSNERGKLERAASACRHQGGIIVASRSVLAEPRAPGNDATWTTLKVKFPGKDRTSVQAAVAAARVTSVTEPEEVSGPTWCPEKGFNLQVAFEVINSRNALSGAGSDGLRVSHLHSIIRTQFGQ